MDLLRFLFTLPFKILRWGVYLLLILLQGVFFVLKPLIGKVDWLAPKWTTWVEKGFKRSEQWVRDYTRMLAILLPSLMIITGIGYSIYHWHLNRPKPVEIAPIVYIDHKIRLYRPNKTDYRRINPKPNSLALAFDQSAAPLEKIDKAIEDGIAISPIMPGKWHWASERKIVFTPEKDWSIGQKYTVTLDPNVLLPEQGRLEEKQYTFDIADFSYTLAEREFYQNPQNPMDKNAIYHIKFNYPVDPKSFEKGLSLVLESPDFPGGAIAHKAPYKYSIKYDDRKMDAWIRSESVHLPNEASQMQLTIAQGIKSTLGGRSSQTAANYALSVPSIKRELIDDIAITIVEGENHKQQHVLIVTTKDEVTLAELAKNIKVWVLPKDRPTIGEERSIRNYHWTTDDDIHGKIIKDYARLLAITMDDTSHDTDSVASFKLNVNPDEYIYVAVGEDFTTVGGYKPRKTTYDVLKVPDYPIMLDFLSEGAILSLKGERTLSAVARNIPGIALDIKRVIPNQLHHLVAFNQSGRFVDMDFGSLSSEHFIEQFRYERALPKTAAGELIYEGIDLSAYLEKEHYGLFLVTLSPWDPENGGYYSRSYSQSRLILITDIGIIVKESLDNSRDLFVQSISNGTPIAAATVTVIGKNGLPILSAKSDTDGHIAFGDFSAYHNEKEPQFYRVEKEGDLSFLPISSRVYDRELNLSRFDVGGGHESHDKGELTGYVFSDRGLYRPGDQANFGLIVRALDWGITVDGMPVEVEVRDPRGKLYQKETFALGKNGFSAFNFSTKESDPTGNWPVTLYLVKNTHERSYLGATTINVKEFEPDRMKVSIDLTPSVVKGWVTPEALKAKVRVENLFGVPAQNRKVESTITLSPMNLYFERYGEYHFFDQWRARKNHEITLDAQTTDLEGEANIPLMLHEIDQASYRLYLVTEAFEAGGGRSVAQTANVLVSPNPFLIGGKADGSLDYIQKDTTRNLELIAINQNLEKIAVPDLKVALVEHRYISVLTKQDSGVYKYQSKKHEKVLGEYDLALNAEGTRYPIETKEPGDYELRVYDTNNTMLYTQHYSVTGNANITRSLERNSELKIKLNKTHYAPGAPIELSIISPYAGSGLITIERDKVYTWQWFKTDTTSSVQTITLPEDIEGNGFVNVQFVRDLNSEEIFMSPLSYGVVPFSVDMDGRRAAIGLEVKPLAKPGEKLPIKVLTNNAQQVVVFAIDEGILQVARYYLTDPLTHFFSKRRLSVRSFQILDLILPEFSRILALTSAPGGDGVEEMDRHLNPFKRKREAPVTFWSGILTVDGEEELTYEIPDYFNGKLRVMTVSVAQERIGTAQTYVNVRDDFVLTPNVPYMAAPGDEFEITVGVSNTMSDLEGREIPIAVTLETTPHLEILDEQAKTLNLGEGRESSLSYRVRVTETLGSAEYTFNATYQKQEGAPFETLSRFGSTSIRPLLLSRVQTVMGRMDGKQEEIALTRTLYNPYSKRLATVGHSPLILTSGLTEFLISNPHSNSESIISRSFMGLVLRAYPELLSRDAISIIKGDERTLYATLTTRQNSFGAIGEWRAASMGDRSVTLYAAQYLIEAKARGVAIPSELLKGINRYLKTIALDRDLYGDYGFYQRAYAIYLLTRQGEVTTTLLGTLQDHISANKGPNWQHQMSDTALYIAATYQLLKMDKDAEKMLKPTWKLLKTAYSKAWWNHDYYDPLVQNANAIYLISRHFPEKVMDIPAEALQNMTLMLRANRNTAYSSAQTILAIDEYTKGLEAHAAQKLKGEKGLTILARAKAIDNDVRTKKARERLITEVKTSLIEGTFSDQDEAVILRNTTSTPAWYAVVEAGYDKTPPKAAIKNGLEVYRDYHDSEGNSIDRVQLGAVINVTLRIRSRSKEGIGGVAIIDLLPGGFEMVQQTPPTDHADDKGWVSPVGVGGTWSPEFSDVREDRLLIYGAATSTVQTFSYQIKATNVGTYQIPALFGEALYDREINAVSASQGLLVVEPKE